MPDTINNLLRAVGLALISFIVFCPLANCYDVFSTAKDSALATAVFSFLIFCETFIRLQRGYKRLARYEAHLAETSKDEEQFFNETDNLVS